MRVLLMIPCYNEANNVGKLLEEIRQQGTNFDTIVVDDASTDNTYHIVKQYSPCIKLCSNLGIGGAVQTAIKYALENNYDICIQVDGDGQHPPSEVEKLVNQYRKKPANLLIGSRFLTEGEFKSSAVRRIGITIISIVIALLYGRKITDPTSGLRLMDRNAIRLFSKDYPHDFPEPISLTIALEQGMKVVEVPVNMKSRKHGLSSIAGFKTAAYMLRVIGYILLTRIGRYI
jgi:glycosyltransferase involved in cell wall biosynthesis